MPSKKPPVEFDLYLAIAQSGPVLHAAFDDWPWRDKPVNLLFTNAYQATIKHLDKGTGFLHPRKTMLDSGAFTMWNLGRELCVDEYIAFIKSQAQIDRDRWTEIVGLDRVGDAEYTYANCSRMRDVLGREVMPVFHIGEDLKWLEKYCAEFGKVGLSCRFGEPVRESLRFYDSCFSACWPHAFHSFGWVKEEMLMAYPFQSADATSWLVSGPRFGNYRAFGGKRKTGAVRLGGREGYLAVKGEIDIALKMERKLKAMWRHALSVL